MAGRQGDEQLPSKRISEKYASLTTTTSQFCISLTAIAHMHGGETEYKWIVSTQRDLKNGNTFVLQLIDDDNSKNQFSTKRFNITEKGAATTTTASSTPTFSETPPTTPSTTASSSSSGLSPQTKVGVGVGVGLGGAFLIALGVVVWYFRRRAKSAAAAAAAPAPGSDVAAPVYYAPVSTMDPYKQEGIPQQPQQQGPVEVPADSGVNAELPGDRGVEVPAQPAARYELP